MNGNGAMEPGLADSDEQAQQALEKHEGSGEAPVLVVQHSLRAVLSRFCAAACAT